MPRYNYNKGKYTEFNKLLSSIDWQDRLRGLNVNEMWTLLLDAVTEGMKRYVPLCKDKRRKFPVWMNKCARRARNSKIKTWNRYNLSKSYNDEVEYKLALQKSQVVYENSKKKFEAKLATEINLNPKSFYSYVRKD